MSGFTVFYIPSGHLSLYLQATGMLLGASPKFINLFYCGNLIAIKQIYSFIDSFSYRKLDSSRINSEHKKWTEFLHKIHHYFRITRKD